MIVMPVLSIRVFYLHSNNFECLKMCLWHLFDTDDGDGDQTDDNDAGTMLKPFSHTLRGPSVSFHQNSPMVMMELMIMIVYLVYSTKNIRIKKLMYIVAFRVMNLAFLDLKMKLVPVSMSPDLISEQFLRQNFAGILTFCQNFNRRSVLYSF